jgi:hypothetical protein
MIFATGIPPQKNEPSTVRIAGKVVFVGCEWRSAATLFESDSYDKHLVNTMHLQEMLGLRTHSHARAYVCDKFHALSLTELT